jgi:hypothetical protein
MGRKRYGHVLMGGFILRRFHLDAGIRMCKGIRGEVTPLNLISSLDSPGESFSYPDGESPGWVHSSECLILTTISLGNVKFSDVSRKAAKTLVVLG